MESFFRRMSTNDVLKNNSDSTTNGSTTNGSSSSAGAAAVNGSVADTGGGKYTEYIRATQQEPSLFKEHQFFSKYQEPSSVTAVLDAALHKENMDDRKMFLEHGLNFISGTLKGTWQQKAQNEVIKKLYDDLPHPPATSLGTDYAWRRADGSCNNMDIPHLGKAGEPYTRSVQQSHPLPRHQLPDPGLVFDTLLKREKFVEHPAGLSALMFGFAALVIHTVFRTGHEDVNINETSSYVDLAPLYGNDQATQDAVRDKRGRGMLHKDSFAENRLLLLPPATCAILVCFSRNHNFIAERLLEINERQTWEADISKLENDPEALQKQDEEIFQTARLVNCGWFGSAVFADYVHCILGLVRQGSSWTLDPFSELRKEDHSLFERGKGNACSFNCLYRWHATTSVHDEAWVEKVMTNHFPDKKIEDITSQDFKAVAYKMVKEIGPDLTHWTFGNMVRKEDGAFDDEQLADILHNATEQPAGAFRARGTPSVMRLHEMMGIEQNRKWGVCSMNDFRRFLGLKPYANFHEWNSDPEIANAAKTLYGDIERLELYVGLQAEEAKPVVEGAGLCPGYTISRAILSDAVALTRGDRFFTHDFTPFNLTAWGFADCQRDDMAHGFGSVLARLFLRTLPGQFTEDSVYGFFPLMTPQAMGVVLRRLGKEQDYSLARPEPAAKEQVVTTHNGVRTVLTSEAFVSPTGARARRVRGKDGLTFPLVITGKEQQMQISKIFQTPETAKGVADYFKTMTRHLLDLHGCPLPGTRSYVIDVVRDVLKPLPALWAANELAGIQLKETKHSEGAYTVDEFYSMLSETYEYIFLDIEASRAKTVECRVRKYVEELLGHITTHLNNTFPQKASILAQVLNTIMSKMPWSKSQKKSEHEELVRRLQQLAPSSSALADTILAIIISVVDISLGLTNVVNAYLGPHKETEPVPPHVDAFIKAAKPEELESFILEALRHDPPTRCMQRLAVQDHVVENLRVEAGSRLFLDLGQANKDEDVFPSPGEHRIGRPKEKHLFGEGALNVLGQDMVHKIYAEVLTVIFSHPNVRRTVGQSGMLQRFRTAERKALNYAYLDSRMMISPWPSSMMIQYDV
ncbi:heme peroxidase [Schizophyllum fasciatum]